jgi:hypothetical protein
VITALYTADRPAPARLDSTCLTGSRSVGPDAYSETSFANIEFSQQRFPQAQRVVTTPGRGTMTSRILASSFNLAHVDVFSLKTRH